jgi:hypothetical protein
MEAAGSSKILVTTYKTKWHDIPHDNNLQKYVQLVTIKNL